MCKNFVDCLYPFCFFSWMCSIYIYVHHEGLPSEFRWLLRYEVFICGDNKIEKMETGALDILLPYLPALKDLYAKGSSSNLKLQLPENLHGSRWFTKSTLNRSVTFWNFQHVFLFVAIQLVTNEAFKNFHRFLNVVSSPELVNETKSIREEMSQLEEARKFQISVPAPKVIVFSCSFIQRTLSSFTTYSEEIGILLDCSMKETLILQTLLGNGMCFVSLFILWVLFTASILHEEHFWSSEMNWCELWIWGLQL